MTTPLSKPLVKKLSKRFKVISSKITEGKCYLAEEAFALLHEVSKTKFNESIDVSIVLGVDARKSDQVVRGAVVLPHGTGRSVRVAVLTQGPNVEAAKAAGAEFVGLQDLAQEIKNGMMDFDVLIASPDAMGVVGQLGQILGPKGLMPNPKVGTVSMDVATAVRNAKAGQVRYRIDKGGIIHSLIGKVDFTPANLKENLITLLNDIKKAKPSSAKGVYIKKVFVSSTMGPGLWVDLNSIEANV